MSNEELAILAQQGDKNAAFELWEQVRFLIYKLMIKYYPVCPMFGLEPDDLRQSGYFAFVRAVRAYKPEKDALFVSYLGYHVQNVVQEAFGRRGKQSQPPVIVSLDEPVRDIEGDGLTLGDSIPDERAAAEFERIQDSWQREHLAVTVRECFSELPEKHRDVLHARYFEGKTLKETGQATGRSKEAVRQQEIRALKTLRTPPHADKLKPYYNALDFIGTRAHAGVGFAAFKRRRASVQEWLVEYIERIQAREQSANEPQKE